VPTAEISGENFQLTIGVLKSDIQGSPECGAWDQYDSSSYNPESNPSAVQDDSDACIRIFVGKERCLVDTVDSTDADEHRIACTLVQPPKAGSNNLVVIATATGGFQIEQLSSAYVLNNPSPAEGSIYGGTIVTLTGSGFCEMTTVSVLDNGSCIQDIQGQCQDCAIQSLTATEIICEMPGSNTATTADIQLHKNGSPSSFPSVNFNYDSAKTPVITAISIQSANRKKRSAQVLSASGGTGDTLVIQGSGWSLDQSSIAILTGDAECVITSFTNTEIQCTVGSHTAGDVAVIFQDAILGYANLDVDFEFLLDFLKIPPSNTKLPNPKPNLT
jgi:hypothetical protein